MSALALRFQQLGDRSLGLDEAVSVVLAGRPLPDIMQAITTEDVQPPLYPVLLHLWMAVAGSGEFAVRLPSVVAGVALVPLLYAAGMRLESLARPQDRPPFSLAGLLGALLATASASCVAISREAGPYMTFVLVGSLSSYLLLRALSAPSRGNWGGYAVATAVALYTHYAAFLLIACQILFVALTSRSFRGAWRGWLLSLAAAVALYIPWMGFSISQIQRIGDPWAQAPRFDIGSADSLLDFIGANEARLLATALGFGILALGILALLAGTSRTRSSAHTHFLLLHLIVPIALLPILDRYDPWFNPRYLLIALPAFYLTEAWGIAALLRFARLRGSPTALRVVLPSLGLAALAATLAVPPAYGRPWVIEQVGQGPGGIRQWGGYRALVSYIESHSRPGDAIVLMRNAYQPYAYYSRLQIPSYHLEPLGDYQDAVQRLNDMAEQHQRLWFILWQEEWADPADYVMHLMEEQAMEVRLDRSFGGIGLRLFELPRDRKLSPYPEIANRTELLFGGVLELLGWNASASRVAAGGTVAFDLQWRPEERIGSDLKARLSLVDAEEHVWAHTDRVMVSPQYPSSRWREQEILYDRYQLTVPPGTPPGGYRVELSVYDPTTLKRLDFAGWSGLCLGTTLSLGQIGVTATPPAAFEAAARGPSATVPPQPSLRTTLAGIKVAARSLLDSLSGPPPSVDPAPLARWDLGNDRIELLGGQVSTVFIKVGETQEVTLWWRAPATPASDFLVRMAILDPNGKLSGEQTFTIALNYPTSRWRPGEVVVAKYWLPIPADLSANKHYVAVTPVGAQEKELPAARYAQAAVMETLRASEVAP